MSFDSSRLRRPLGFARRGRSTKLVTNDMGSGSRAHCSMLPPHCSAASRSGYPFFESWSLGHSFSCAAKSRPSHKRASARPWRWDRTLSAWLARRPGIKKLPPGDCQVRPASWPSISASKFQFSAAQCGCWLRPTPSSIASRTTARPKQPSECSPPPGCARSRCAACRAHAAEFPGSPNRSALGFPEVSHSGPPVAAASRC